MDNFEKNKRIVQERTQQNKQRREAYKKKRLEENITKKIRTTMIGALKSFEDGFGYLWGINLDFDQLTNEQIKFNDLWEDVRNDVLNKGNSQIRAAQDELEEYWMDYKHKVDFIIKGK